MGAPSPSAINYGLFFSSTETLLSHAHKPAHGRGYPHTHTHTHPTLPPATTPFQVTPFRPCYVPTTADLPRQQPASTAAPCPCCSPARDTPPSSPPPSGASSAFSPPSLMSSFPILPSFLPSPGPFSRVFMAACYSVCRAPVAVSNCQSPIRDSPAGTVCACVCVCVCVRVRVCVCACVCMRSVYAREGGSERAARRGVGGRRENHCNRIALSFNADCFKIIMIINK
eukprot:GHVU01187262.1.p1 GENE.GHVU01187262.1~~GHVU01187262.1.p1  ORF type:complete len:227 (+),score=6.19 GHVU01187262.1:87-767(+)